MSRFPPAKSMINAKYFFTITEWTGVDKVD
jgi:hypothetical protein